MTVSLLIFLTFHSILHHQGISLPQPESNNSARENPKNLPQSYTPVILALSQKSPVLPTELLPLVMLQPSLSSLVFYSIMMTLNTLSYLPSRCLEMNS